MSTFVSEGTPVLLQTITVFEGRGLDAPAPLGLAYTVPKDRTSGMFYFRGGSSVSGLVNISVRHPRLARDRRGAAWRHPDRDLRCRRGLGDAGPGYWVHRGVTR
jgi:hypothetical protein